MAMTLGAMTLRAMTVMAMNKKKDKMKAINQGDEFSLVSQGLTSRLRREKNAIVDGHKWIMLTRLSHEGYTNSEKLGLPFTFPVEREWFKQRGLVAPESEDCL